MSTMVPDGLNEEEKKLWNEDHGTDVAQSNMTQGEARTLLLTIAFLRGERDALAVQVSSLVLSLTRVGQGHAHYEKPHTLKPFDGETLHGPLKHPGGPCLCRWCEARRLVDSVALSSQEQPKTSTSPAPVECVGCGGPCPPGWTRCFHCFRKGL